MTIESAIRERLLAITSLTAQVSTRIYQQLLPQHATLPAVRLQLISEPVDYHQRGEINLYTSRIQVDAYAAEASGVDALTQVFGVAQAVHGTWMSGSPPSGLSGWGGILGGSPALIEVLHIGRVAKLTRYEADELRFVRVQQDYLVTWRWM